MTSSERPRLIWRTASSPVTGPPVASLTPSASQSTPTGRGCLTKLSFSLSPSPFSPLSLRRGVNKWRDRELPVQLLEDWCKMMDVNPPEWSHDKRKVVVDHTEYSLDHFGESTTFIVSSNWFTSLAFSGFSDNKILYNLSRPHLFLTTNTHNRKHLAWSNNNINFKIFHDLHNIFHG